MTAGPARGDSASGTEARSAPPAPDDADSRSDCRAVSPAAECHFG